MLLKGGGTSKNITKTKMEVLRIYWPLFSTAAAAAIFVQVWTVEPSLFTLFLDAVEPGSQSDHCLFSGFFFSRGIVSS